MNKKIVFMVDGKLRVVTPAPKALEVMSIDDIAKQSVPNGVEYKIIHEKDLPNNRGFREAWSLKDGKPFVDMTKAREIQMGRIRELRNKELARLDIEQMRGLDVNEKKKVLRDLPENINLDAIEDEDELLNFYPRVLKDG